FALLPVSLLLLALPARAEAPGGSEVREVDLVVEKGYKPGSIEVREGEPLRLKVVRKDYSPCTKELVIPSLGIRRDLPVNKLVVIELPPLEAGEVELHCGMKMVRGTIRVEPKP
ncbi:MAG: cupredoxin domain-containing protein, partial [Myxococcales bacterium]